MLRLKRTPFAPLKKQLKKLDNAPVSLYEILVLWISRCDGFLYDTYVLDHSDHTAAYVTEKTIALLSKLDKQTSKEEILQLLANEFEGLYFYAYAKDDQQNTLLWESTQESYQAFLSKQVSSSQNHYLDQPHCAPTTVLQWLNDVLANPDQSGHTE